MLRYLPAADLARFPRLAETMFRDRATQFRDRLGWDVTVDGNGFERDGYDAAGPLYVVWENADGSHGGSMRFLPTTGDTMVNDHFLGLTDGVAFRSPFIWECTRFCLAPGSGAQVAAALMLGGGELMRAFDLTHFVGVFDARMVRIYARIGASPEVLGQSGTGRDLIAVGLWPFRPEDRVRVLARAEVGSETSEEWFRQSFGHGVVPEPARTAA